MRRLNDQIDVDFETEGINMNQKQSSRSDRRKPMIRIVFYEEINNISAMGTYRFVAKLIAPLTTRNNQRMGFWKPIAGFDPLPYWESVEQPVFENDKNVPVEESIKRLGFLEKEIRIQVYPDGSHGITDPITGSVQTEYLNDLVEFSENPK